MHELSTVTTPPQRCTTPGQHRIVGNDATLSNNLSLSLALCADRVPVRPECRAGKACLAVRIPPAALRQEFKVKLPFEGMAAGGRQSVLSASPVQQCPTDPLVVWSD